MTKHQRLEKEKPETSFDTACRQNRRHSKKCLPSKKLK